MYVNPDLHRQYLFLRSDGNRTYLVAANFSDEVAEVKVNIPDEACNSFGMKNISSVSIKIDAWDGIIKRI